MDATGGTFRPARYSDVPLYNIQAVASATGVPAITLRSWERRYGVPVPRRDEKGYRLYSERDIAVARWLKERVQRGVGISRAVNMLRVLERGDLSPTLSQTFDFGSLLARLLDAVSRLDEAQVRQVIGEALIVASVEDVALGLLQPALYRIGDLWAAGQVSVTSEHVASNVIRAQLAHLLRLSPAPLRAERILVGSAPGELHDIGALMLALVLRRRGFEVLYAGASVESESLRHDVETILPAAVCLSAAAPPTAETLGRLYAALASSYRGILAYGGRAFNEHPEIGHTMVGMYLGVDAVEAVARLESALAN